MAQNLWKQIVNTAKKQGRPAIVMAPLANVTDIATRQLFAKYGKVS